MSSGTQPSLNAFCSATTAIPTSQLSTSELHSIRRATVQYFTLQQQHGVFAAYRAPFLSNTQRTLYRKAQMIATGPKGPVLSQQAAAEIRILQAAGEALGCT